MNVKCKAAMVVGLVLTLLGLVACVTQVGQTQEVALAASDYVYAALLVLVTVYSLAGYRLIRGSLLKWLMLVFAVCLISRLNVAIYHGDALHTAIYPIIMMLITYIAARLEHVRQNAILMAITFVLLCCQYVSVYVGVVVNGWGIGFDPLIFLCCCAPVIVWLDICCGYLVLCERRKAAGFAD